MFKKQRIIAGLLTSFFVVLVGGSVNYTIAKINDQHYAPAKETIGTKYHVR